MRNYLDLAQTDTIRALQERKGSLGRYDTTSPGPDALEPHEVEHLQRADSFYMATVTEDGWPYVQHRGGDRGFVRVLDGTTIGWIERSGNRQYLGTGNLLADGRVSLIFVDYPTRTRLKLLGHGTYHAEPDDELLGRLGHDGSRHDGAITVQIEATAWNCPKFITPRFDEAQVAAMVEPLHARITELEKQLAESRPD